MKMSNRARERQSTNIAEMKRKVRLMISSVFSSFSSDFSFVSGENKHRFILQSYQIEAKQKEFRSSIRDQSKNSTTYSFFSSIILKMTVNFDEFFCRIIRHGIVDYCSMISI